MKIIPTSKIKEWTKEGLLKFGVFLLLLILIFCAGMNSGYISHRQKSDVPTEENQRHLKKEYGKLLRAQIQQIEQTILELSSSMDAYFMDDPEWSIHYNKAIVEYLDLAYNIEEKNVSSTKFLDSDVLLETDYIVDQLHILTDNGGKFYESTNVDDLDQTNYYINLQEMRLNF